MTDQQDLEGLSGLVFDRRRFLQGTGGVLMAPVVASLAGKAFAQEKVHLTVWAWTPKTQDMANLYMAKNPNVTVTVENVGQGAPHYVKLRNAIEAGTGLPDVAMMEFNSLASFKALNVLADLAPLGATAVKDKYIDWTWKAVSDGDKVIGLPWDSGPMGLLYRQDIFEKHSINVPGTWDEFAAAAEKLAAAAPGTYLTNLGVDSGWTAAVLWQKGWRPFHLDGEKISININDAIAKDWASYWQKLVDAKAVNNIPPWTTEWFAAFDDGVNASWVTAAWAPVLMQQSMHKSAGKWRAAPMPQWQKGGNVASNWGGSTFVALNTTQHLKEAAEFAIFMSTDPTVARKWNTDVFLFPVLKELITDQEIIGHKYDFYGGQAVNEIFAKAEGEVDPSFEFAPFQDYVNSQIEDHLATAIAGKGTIAEAFDRVQDAVVTYARDQGYTVA